MECAVLFADVAGSTALYEVLGDERAFALVERCLAAMGDCTAEAGGRVVKTIGDAVMSVFPSADAAAGAAIAMQERVDRMGPQEGVRLRLRIGFHFGPVVERDGDVFGDTVNLASRLGDLASKGQVVTDEESARRLGAATAPRLRPLFSVPVKGKEAEVALVEIGWQEPGEERTLIAAPRSTTPAGHALLKLRLDDRHVEMGPARRKVTVGRDLECDFPIRDRSASRAHATIERRRERFVLADHSSNGTFVTFEGKPEMKVQHEDVTLVGHGWIAFGQPRAEASQVAEFQTAEA